jgi:hypothetical protein
MPPPERDLANVSIGRMIMIDDPLGYGYDPTVEEPIPVSNL